MALRGVWKRFGGQLKFLPLFALYYFHEQKAEYLFVADGRSDRESLIEWYRRIAGKTVKLTCILMAIPAALSVLAPSPFFLAVLLVLFIALHNYSELYVGALVERKLDALRNREPPDTETSA